MELWIRSQDKEELLKINARLFIKEITNVGFSIENDLCTDDGFISLGIYETKERALEVLDEIQSYISILNAMSLCHNENMLIALNSAVGEKKLNNMSSPYEMPEE
jgi:hypothetical protein